VDEVVGPVLVLTAEPEGDRTVVAIKGELDAYTAPALEAEIARLMDDAVTGIVLNLAETAFLDSSGLRAILTAQRKLQDHHGSLTLRTPSEPVTRLLEITGLTEHFATETA
jgi:anti-sigma B factor antagonist